MNQRWPNIDIKEIFLAIKEAKETGRFPHSFKMKPDELRTTLREIRPVLIDIQDMLERMEQSAVETADRVTIAVDALQKEYKKEAEFLQILVTHKLGSIEFQEKLINLMCELSNAKQGLLDPTKSVLVVTRYLALLEEMKKDTDLQDEVSRILTDNSNKD